MNKWIGIAVVVILLIGIYIAFSGGSSDEAGEAQPAETNSEAATGGSN